MFTSALCRSYGLLVAINLLSIIVLAIIGVLGILTRDLADDNHILHVAQIISWTVAGWFFAFLVYFFIGFIKTSIGELTNFERSTNIFADVVAGFKNLPAEISKAHALVLKRVGLGGKVKTPPK